MLETSDKNMLIRIATRLEEKKNKAKNNKNK